MVNAKLMINLDPPTMGLEIEGNKSYWRPSTADEIKSLLLELDLLTAEQPWPPRELVVGLAGSFSENVLSGYGLTGFASVSEMSRRSRRLAETVAS
jgi:hypothetical protein